MNIRNHGFDTIKITFANGKPNSTQSNYFSSTMLDTLHTKLLSIKENSKDSWILIPNSSTYIDMGLVDNFHFNSSRQFSSLYISLPRFLYGTNVDGLNANDIGKVIGKLSDLLEIDAGKARVQRIDYCFNFNSDSPWDTFIHNIECNKQRYETLLYDKSTFYVQNKSREICFYSQVDGRYSPKKHKREVHKIETIKRQVLSNNLFRVELKLFKDAIKTIQCVNTKSKGVIFQDLLEHENRALLFEKYKSLIEVPHFIDPIDKDNSTPFNLTLKNGATMNDHYIHMLAYNIHQRGITAVTNEASIDKFSSKHFRKEIKKKIEHAEILVKNMLDNNTIEIPSQIQSKILKEIAREYQSNPKELF